MKFLEPKWAKYIREDNIEDGDVQALVPLIGLDAVKKIMIRYAGTHIIVPKQMLTKYKHQYILDNYDGTKLSRMKLALECEFTEGYVYKIIKKYKSENITDLCAPCSEDEIPKKFRRLHFND